MESNMNQSLDMQALEQAFFNARTFNKFTQQKVSDALIMQLYDLMKWGPTSMNCQPGHYVFIKSEEAKQRLKSALMPGNQDKTMAAPATVIVAFDTQFYKHLPLQFPANPNAQAMFEANPEMSQPLH
jgi:3-hydroxypropanoate dehydrogenase